MYIVKEHDERRTEFLDTATVLFMQHGYEQTSVNAIIDAMSVSKGAFYHYFKSKEELLDQIADRAAGQALAGAQAILDDPNLNAIAKLNALFAQTNGFKARNKELMRTIGRVFYSDSNILLRTRLSQRSVERVAPVLARILEQGADEGSMDVVHPHDTARFVLRIGTDLIQTFAKSFDAGASDIDTSAQMRTELYVYQRSVERILGVSEGSLRLVDEALITLMEGEEHD